MTWQQRRSWPLWVNVAVVAALLLAVLLCLAGCEDRAVVAPPPDQPLVQPSAASTPATPAAIADSTPLPSAISGLDGAGRILWLTGMIAREKAIGIAEKLAAHQRITEMQSRWGTWAAGLTFLGGLVWFVASWWLQLPKAWGGMGMALGAGLLIGARVWSKLGEISGPLGTIALAGGLLTAVGVLVWKHRKELKGLVR